MLEYLMPICAFIAGSLIYYALREDVEEGLSIKLDRNLLFPVFIIILIVSGVYVAESIHLSEVAKRASNAQQSVSVMGCILETTVECSTNANNINNVSSTRLQAGEVQSAQFYVPFSLRDTIPRNILTWFASGMLLIWIIIAGMGKYEKSN